MPSFLCGLMHHLPDVFFYITAFSSTPKSVNVTLGSTATFSCSATTGAVVWIVNGTPFTQLNTSDIRTRNNGRTLHVKAEEEYDNLNLTCAVLYIYDSGSENLLSDPAVLRVQGIVCFACKKMLS